MVPTLDTQADIRHLPTEEKDSEGAIVADASGSSPPNIEFPEGGWKAWSVVLGVFLHQFVTLGYTNAYGVYNAILPGVEDVPICNCFFPDAQQVALAQGFGLGIASGMTYVPSLAVITHYFFRRRTVAMGIASSGCAIGACLHTIMLNKLFHGRVGFHVGVRASAGLNLGILVLAMLLMRTRLPPRSSRNGDTLQEIKTFFWEPAYLSAVLGSFFILLGIFFPTFFLQLKSIENGLSPDFAFYTLVILNMASGFGRVIPNIIARPLGVINVMIFCMTSLGIMAFSLLLVKDVPRTVVFAILYGFFSGSYAGVVAPMVASLARNDGEIGSRIGLCFAVAGIAGLIGKNPHIGSSAFSVIYMVASRCLLRGFCTARECIDWICAASCVQNQEYMEGIGYARRHLNEFEVAISQLVHHPEYNSTLILRSDTVAELESDFPEAIPRLNGRRLISSTHRRLLARRPGRDVSLEQYCSLYEPEDSSGPSPDTLLLTPIVQPGESLPYYHPAVSHLAFRYVRSDPPTLRIEVIPLPNIPTDPNARLYRTCLALLDTLDRYGWGALTHYKKRVMHDCLVPREPYQDLYLIMRERHKHLVDTWQEVTDPLKHDIGIATYLMLLWKDTFSADASEHETLTKDIEQPWRSWPRPPGGFLDFGCGNGLLTHILTQEGYKGRGIDLRARTSWSHYPESTQDSLHVHAFDPTTGTPDPYFQPGIFIIGNHADELTPWVPLLSTLQAAAGYINIPCCAWIFDAKFERNTTPMFPTPGPDFADTLNLGGQGDNGSSYSMYRIWLASLTLYCGWEIECETLRIPSTRNWAIIGRRKSGTMTEDEAQENVRVIMQNVAERGLFKARKPEGKDDGH
ncbi:hypothetical protein DXG01_008262 [Tephrocybe rancida]|nr:hypothetical protein DXG01_008262 [Tephrocybe rancida]